MMNWQKTVCLQALLGHFVIGSLASFRSLVYFSSLISFSRFINVNNLALGKLFGLIAGDLDQIPGHPGHSFYLVLDVYDPFGKGVIRLKVQ